MSEMVERVARAISTYAIMYSHETVGDDLRTRNKLWQVYELAKAEPDKPPTEFIGRFTDKFEAQKFCAQMNARAAIEAMQPEWQPIETAPKDGTTVDLWIVSACPEADHQMVDFYSPTARKVSGQPLRHGRVAAVEWRTKRPNLPAWYPAGSLCGYPLSPEVKATHWMRPPAPPADPALRNRKIEHDE